MNNAALFDLTGQVYINLKRSAIAYREYLQAGKTFMHARILKIYNEKIRELLLQKGYLLPDALQENAMSLIAHYDIWLAKWNELQEKLDPAPQDEFVFANDFTFPKDASLAFETAYGILKRSGQYDQG